MNTKLDESQISIVSGGAGFIGNQIIGRLISEGRGVAVVDNFSRGLRAHLDVFAHNSLLHIIEADLSIRRECMNAFDVAATKGRVVEVWHLAANSDIPAGVADPDVDLKDTFLTTFELLRCMKIFGIKSFHFASSSAVYGDLGSTPLHEGIVPLLPISNYGAMKLASEAQASAAAESFLERVNIFRFPNVVGIPATHGVIFDFILKLLSNQDVLHVLGDGSQQKAYMHVSDLVDAMFTVSSSKINEKIEVINIGPVDEGVSVRWIAEQVVARVSPYAKIKYGNGNKGWVGDVPRFNYSTDRLQSYGWSPKLNSSEAIIRAIDEIAIQKGF